MTKLTLEALGQPARGRKKVLIVMDVGVLELIIVWSGLAVFLARAMLARWPTKPPANAENFFH